MHIQVSGSGTLALVDFLQLGFDSPDNISSVSGTTAIQGLEPVSISGYTDITNINPVSITGYVGITINPEVSLSGYTSIAIDTTSPPVIVSGTGTVNAGYFRSDLSGTITVQNTGFETLSGTLSVSRPADLSGTLTTTKPADLSGTISIIGVTDADLSGTLTTNYDFIRELPGRIAVVQPQDLPGTITTTAPVDLPGYIDVKAVADLSGTLWVSPPSYLSGTLTTTAPIDLSGTITTTAPIDLSGTIDVIRPFDDLSGTLSTTAPVDLPGYIDVSARYDSYLSGTVTTIPATEFSYLSGTITTHYAGVDNLSGTLTTSRDASADLPGYIDVIDRLSQNLSGTLQVKPYSDLSGQIITVRPSSDLPGRIKVGNKEFEEISGTISVWRPVDLSGQIEVVRPSADVSGTISLIPYLDLSGTVTVESPTATLSGTMSVAYFGQSDLSGTIVTDKYYEYLSGTLEVRGKSVDLPGYILVDKYTSSNTLPGVIIVTWASQNRDLPAKIEIQPYVDLNGEILVERPSEDLDGTITVVPRFDNNIGIDTVYAQDKYSISTFNLTPISGTVGPDIVEISQSDEFTWDWLPHIRVTGTDLMEVGQNDDFEIFMYGEETTEWSYPIQLTDNILLGNDFSLPTITEFDNRIYVSYNHNFNNEFHRTIVVKTQDGGKRPNEKWIVSNIYPDVYDGQFVGPDAQMIHEQVHGFVLHPGPQASEANDFFDSEIVFAPESYEIEGSMYRDLWETLQYQMQKQGEIFYPPTQWSANPLSESIFGPEDNFDPIPKPGNFVPTNDDGYYQDFGNFFTGNG